MSISLAFPIRLLTAWCEQLALYDSLSSSGSIGRVCVAEESTTPHKVQKTPPQCVQNHSTGLAFFETD
jgi:hypothetical protein